MKISTKDRDMFTIVNCLPMGCHEVKFMSDVNEDGKAVIRSYVDCKGTTFYINCVKAPKAKKGVK